MLLTILLLIIFFTTRIRNLNFMYNFSSGLLKKNPNKNVESLKKS